MLKFHFKFDGDEQSIECDAGRSSLWKAQDYGSTLPASAAKQGKTDFAWGYYAAKQNGILQQLGVDPDEPVSDALDHIADCYDLTITDNTHDDAPLADGGDK